MKKGFVLLALSCAFTSAAQADIWSRGEITRIWQHGEQGEFSIALDPEVQDCRDHLIEFSGTHYDNAERRGQALSIALSALHGGKAVGVELSATGADGHCLARGIDIQR